MLLFFWAHWCGDCKLERRDISQVRREFARNRAGGDRSHAALWLRGKGEEANPQQELKYIDEIRLKYYLDLSDMPVPLSEQNLKTYGVSTTPTMVLIDKHGIVRLYHPGSMTAAELSQAIRAAL